MAFPQPVLVYSSVSQGGVTWRPFCLSQLGRCCWHRVSRQRPGRLWSILECRRQLPPCNHHPHHLIPNVNCAEVEKICFRAKPLQLLFNWALNPMQRPGFQKGIYSRQNTYWVTVREKCNSGRNYTTQNYINSRYKNFLSEHKLGIVIKLHWYSVHTYTKEALNKYLQREVEREGSSCTVPQDTVHGNIKSRQCAVLGCCAVLNVPDSLQPYRLWPTRLLCPWDFPSKNTGVGCHALFQEIFPTQGSNPCLLYWQVDSLPLNHTGSLYWVVRGRLNLLPSSAALASSRPVLFSGFLCSYLCLQKFSLMHVWALLRGSCLFISSLAPTPCHRVGTWRWLCLSFNHTEEANSLRRAVS